MSVSKYLLATCTLFLLVSTVFAQGLKIQGLILDSNDKNPQAGVMVFLTSSIDSFRVGVVTNTEGRFDFNNILPGAYRLSTSYLSYLPIEQQLILSDSNLDLGQILIEQDPNLLRELVVMEKQTRVEQLGDTTQYHADAYKTNRNANVEDLVTKMPGITIEDGVVKVQGEDLKKVTIDGEDFFGDDATLALRNLPAEIVDKIQVFDQLSEQAQFTGFDDGNTQKTLNIVTKSGKSNGQFGKIYAGYGTDDRYIGGANLNYFKGKKRISLIGLSNNINQQNFSTQDLLGVTGSSGASRGGGDRGGRGRSGRRGGSRGQGGSANDFLVGQQAGISKVNSLGLNYSDRWGEKIKVNAAYFFNNNGNGNSSELTREYFLNQEQSQFYDETNQSRSENYNHRFNMRMEYAIDSANSISFRPQISFQDNNRSGNFLGQNYFSLADPLNITANTTKANNTGYDFSNDLLFRHRFSKRGRTASLNIRTSLNDKSGDSHLFAQNQYFEGVDTIEILDQLAQSQSNGFTLSPNLAYTEPVGENGQVQINYSPSFNRNNSDLETNNLDSLTNDYTNPALQLSNQFENEVASHRAGASYQIRKGKVRFSMGLDYQNVHLSSVETFPAAFTVAKTFENLLPNLRYDYRPSRAESFRIRYRTATRAPNVSQLQNVLDNSNQLLLSIGNPDLKQTYNHAFSVRYNKSNAKKATSFFSYCSLGYAENYISNYTRIATRDTVVLEDIALLAGAQLTQPVNLDGYWNLRTFFTYGLPITALKSNLNLNAGFSYLHNPSFVNDLKNLVNTYTTNAGLVIGSNISERLDFTVSYRASINMVQNSIQPELDNNYFYHSTGLKLNWEFIPRLVFNTDLTQTLYTGLGDEFNQQYWLWNTAIGYRMLKDESLEIRLGVFDLLDQNNSIGRSVTETYVEDAVTEVLRRYVMVSAIYSLRNFGGR